MLALCWIIVTGLGLEELSTTGHTYYFHNVSAERMHTRRKAVQAYLTQHDRHLLEAPATKAMLYQGTDEVTRLLDQPKFQALLPSSVNPANPPDLAGRAVRSLQARWLPLGLFALGALLTGLALHSGRSAPEAPPPMLDNRIDPLRLWLVATLGTSALVLLFSWPAPFTFDPLARWRPLVSPAAAVRDLDFKFIGPEPFGNDRIVSAAQIASPELRSFFFGTAPAGPAFQGEIWSRPFRLTAPWLVVPIAGYPVSTGNAIRLRIEDDAGATLEEIDCPGPNPRELAFWRIDVRRRLGLHARLVLYDGRTDTEGWVAVAPAIPTADFGLAERLTLQLPLERLGAAHTSLAWIAIACGAWLALVGTVRLWKNVR